MYKPWHASYNYTSAHTCTHAHIHTCEHTHHTHIHTHVHIRIHIHTLHTYTANIHTPHTYTHIHTCTYIHSISLNDIEDSTVWVCLCACVCVCVYSIIVRLHEPKMLKILPIIPYSISQKISHCSYSVLILLPIIPISFALWFQLLTSRETRTWYIFCCKYWVNVSDTS